MTITETIEQMTQSYPAPINMERAELAYWIEACTECADACLRCADACSRLIDAMG